MRISDWSSDVCSSDLHPRLAADAGGVDQAVLAAVAFEVDRDRVARGAGDFRGDHPLLAKDAVDQGRLAHVRAARSEEHTSELQSLMRISYAVFCLQKPKKHTRSKILQ